MSSYDRALQASAQATAAMAGIAADLQADSRVITTARAAARTDPSAWAGQPLREPSAETSCGRGRGYFTAPRQLQPAPPSPVERTLIELKVTSKPDLEQAAAIDKAADQLILRAAARPRPAQRRDLSRSASTAELDGHLLVTTSGVPAAIRPRQQPVRQAELEAGA